MGKEKVISLAIEFDLVADETNRFKLHPDQLSRLQRAEKLLHHKPRPIFSEASQERNGANHLTFQLEFPVFPSKW